MGHNSEFDKILKKIEDQEKTSRRRAFLMSAISVAIALGFLLVISIKIYRTQMRLEGLRLTEDSLNHNIDSLKKEFEVLQKGAFQAFGVSDSVIGRLEKKEVAQILSANKVLNQSGFGNKPQSATIIRYFPKAKDQEKVMVALKDLGFQPQIINPRAHMRNIPSNTVWYGCDVDFKDVQTVVLYLIRGGIEIKAIEPFNDFCGAKRNAIEIGATTAYQSKPPLSVEQIKNQKGIRTPI